jgi:hypothetical protein
VKTLPCLICGLLKNLDPHHLMRGLPPDERGMGRKASDQWAIPACRADHDALHAAGNDDAWLAERNIDGRAIARALWTKRGDLAAMLRIVARSLNARGVYIG